MAEERVLELLRLSGAFKSGHFVLSSGLHSENYLQCASLFYDPRVGEEIGSIMKGRVLSTLDDRVDVVVSLAMGGIILGYEVARQLGAGSCFLERKHGQKFELRRGFNISGKNIILVEDVVTTFGSVKEGIECIKHNSGNLVGIYSIADRSGLESDDVLGYKHFSLVKLNIKTYKSDELPEFLKEIPVDSPGSRNNV